MARSCRILTASAVMFRTAAVSARLSCSRYRSRITSRWPGSSSSSAAPIVHWLPACESRDWVLVRPTLPRQFAQGGIRERTGGLYFPQHAAPLGVQVLPLHIDHALPGDPPQPGIERHRALPRVLVDCPAGREQRFLYDVRGIDARPHGDPDDTAPSAASDPDSAAATPVPPSCHQRQSDRAAACRPTRASVRLRIPVLSCGKGRA